MNFCGGDGGGGGGGCDENRQKIPRLSSNLVEDPDDYSETEKSDKVSAEIDPGNDLETVKKMMVAKKIFSNHLILCSIFDNSSLTDVRHNFNRVNRTWRAATLHSLSNFQIVRLHLKMSYTLTYSEFSMKIFPANQTRPSITAIPLEPTTKDQFLEKMKDQTHKKVVWLSLTFETYYPSMSHDAFFMMTQIRPWVTRLQIEDNRRDFSDPLKYFKGELPNLEFLNINKMRPLFSLDEQNPSISLTALAQIKTLRFGTIDGSTATPSKWIPQILKAVPNVQKIYGYPFQFLHLLESVEVATVQKIKSISVPNDSYFVVYVMSKKFEVWRYWNQPYCPLTHLEVFKVPSQICKVEPTVRKTMMENLSTMLNSNQLTIQKLELSAVNFLLKIPPKMPALTTLLVNDETDFEKDRRRKCPPRVFSNGFNLSDCCPKIQNLEINMVDMGCVESLLPFKIFQNFHTNIDASTMIRRLKIRQEKGIVGVRVLEGISKRCPQIVSLDVGNSRQWLEDCLPRIWTLWPHLEELTLSVTWHGSRFPRQYLDEAVTGICEEKCAILRQSFIGRKEIRFEEFKKSPGISDMKYLKHFSINFDGYSLNGRGHVDDIDDAQCQQFFSHVSALYGFQMVTGLVVHFSIPFETPRWNQRFESDKKNMKKRLEDIIPFVQFAEINS